MDISIQGLSKIYRRNVRALVDVDLEIPTGMFGLLGPNGAGKTTLMRILAGVYRSTRGVIRVGPHDATTDAGMQEIKRILGYLPQELGLYPDLTAREFLDYVGILKGIDNRMVRAVRVDELLETVALSDARDRKLKEFSGGMKQRVGIAQALLNEPQVLIVDEPTAGLDPEERIRFRNLLSELAGDRTVLLSTHIVEDIAQTCRDLAVLAGGAVIFKGTTFDLLNAANESVWTVTATDQRPTGDFTIVSTLHLKEGVQYRIVGEPPAGWTCESTAPSLEDGYVRLMQGRRESVTV